MPEAPETVARKAVMKRIEEEFAPESIVVKDDKIPHAAGFDGAIAAVSPIRRIPWSKDYQVNRYEILVQFYDRYETEVNINQTVSPTKIEGYADRFCNIFDGNSAPASGETWYFTLGHLDYPDDPTGNKTRFEARLTCWGQGARSG